MRWTMQSLYQGFSDNNDDVTKPSLRDKLVAMATRVSQFLFWDEKKSFLNAETQLALQSEKQKFGLN